jgi:uncharacterized protein (DUF427 family)
LRRPEPVEPGPGQESVWDYPRPPAVDPTTEHVVVEHAGRVLADTRAPVRVLETSHPPTYYLPRADVDTDLLVRSQRRTFCEFKGVASWFDLVVDDRRVPDAVWTYETPTVGFEPIAGHLALYPHLVDRVTVDGEQVRAVQGDFYGGWVTSRVVGPFKGEVPGSRWW